MDANIYIGNAPSLTVKPILERHGIPMSSLFGYVEYPRVFLLPLSGIVT